VRTTGEIASGMDVGGADVRLEARRIEYVYQANLILRGGWTPDNDCGPIGTRSSFPRRRESIGS
jgi:hypothetical protein